MEGGRKKKKKKGERGNTGRGTWPKRVPIVVPHTRGHKTNGEKREKKEGEKTKRSESGLLVRLHLW